MATSLSLSETPRLLEEQWQGKQGELREGPLLSWAWWPAQNSCRPRWGFPAFGVGAPSPPSSPSVRISFQPVGVAPWGVYGRGHPPLFRRGFHGTEANMMQEIGQDQGLGGTAQGLSLPTGQCCQTTAGCVPWERGRSMTGDRGPVRRPGSC